MPIFQIDWIVSSAFAFNLIQTSHLSMSVAMQYTVWVRILIYRRVLDIVVPKFLSLSGLSGGNIMIANSKVKFLGHLFIVMTVLTVCGMPITTYAGEQGDSAVLPKNTENGTNTITLSFLTSKCAICSRLIDLFYTEAFHRIGYQFNQVSHPPKISYGSKRRAGRWGGGASAV